MPLPPHTPATACTLLQFDTILHLKPISLSLSLKNSNDFLRLDYQINSVIHLFCQLPYHLPIDLLLKESC